MNFIDSNKAIYQQIADRICDEILSGTFRCEERIPSVREYAAQLEVNANTMMRTYETLQAQDLIFNKRGIGYFVSPGAKEKILEQRRRLFFDHEVTYFYERLKMFGVTPAELAEAYARHCGKTISNN